MVKAVLQGGVFVPCGPLPADWRDGMELQVEKVLAPAEESAEELQRWMAEVQAAANQMDPEDEMILERALRDIRQRDREAARRDSQKSNGLPS